MAGKSWQPSHEPPRSKRNRHLSHCWNSGKRKGKRGGRTAWAMSYRTTKRKRTLPVCTPHYARLQSTSTWNSNTCAYVLRLLTSMGMQVLFVVNSIKLHLTGLKIEPCIGWFQVCFKDFVTLFLLFRSMSYVHHYLPLIQPVILLLSLFTLCPALRYPQWLASPNRSTSYLLKIISDTEWT